MRMRRKRFVKRSRSRGKVKRRGRAGRTRAVKIGYRW